MTNVSATTNVIAVDNSQTEDVTLTDIYWQTTSAATIAAAILDRSDNYRRGQVTIDPIATGGY